MSTIKKIAFATTAEFSKNGQDIPEMYKKCILPFFQTAKKNVFANKQKYDVEFILLTNSNYTCELDFVKTIRTYEETDGYSYGCLTKSLLLEHIPNEYDYMFVADLDSIFPSEIPDSIFDKPFVFLDHYWKMSSTLKHILEIDTEHVTIDADISNEYWTMDTFFGGTYELMINYTKFARAQHNKYFGKISHGHGFYSKYPGELFILKWVLENKIDHKRLSSRIQFDANSADNNWHIGELLQNYNNSNNGADLEFLKHYSQLHNTKGCFDILDGVVKHIIDTPSSFS